MKVSVIRAPYDSGYHRKRMGLGPERIFESGLKELFARLGAQFQDQEISVKNTYPAEINVAFEVCREVSTEARRSLESGSFPLVLSGNCITAVGTVSGCRADKIGVVWFDAHGESTTPETTRSGFLDGMPISTLLGRAWQNMTRAIPGFTPIPGNRILLFGARDVEPAEHDLLNSAKVLQATAVDQLAKHLVTIASKVRHVYVHVDLDVLDSGVAMANEWATPGGLSVELLLDAIREIRKHTNITALGIASYDPATDRDGRALEAALRVAETVLSAS